MSRKPIVVLGAGMVGSVMARDLAGEGRFRVTVADRDAEALARLKADAPVETVVADLSDLSAVRRLAEAADLVVGAVPGFLGFRTLQCVLECGRPIADIAFMPEDALALDGLAKERGVTAVVDCGVAPGLSNLVLGRHAARFDEGGFEEALVLVGGLPRVRTWPFEYKAPFSPIDVLEEYTRPARYVRDGRVVVLPALSEPEPVDVPGVGTLEAFNTDGLRSLLVTLPCPNMREKTLRWPGHVEAMRVLRAIGLFSETPIEVGGVRVAPRDLAAKLLFPMWKLEPGEEEFTVMRIEAMGREGGVRVRHRWDLQDGTDRRTGFSSMARTTGFPNAIVARLLLDGVIAEKGVLPPERLGGNDAVFAAMEAGLRVRGVALTHSVERV